MDHDVGAARQRLCNVLLLDVGVEGVVHHAEVGMVDVLDHPGSIGRTVQEVDLEPIQVLRGQRHPELFGALGRLAQALGGPAPFVLRGSPAGEYTQRGVDRADQQIRPQRLAALGDVLEMGDSGPALLLVGADEVCFGREDRECGPHETDVLQTLTQLGAFLDVRRHDGDLDGVKPHLLEPLEQRKGFFAGGIGGPQQHIHSVAHGCFLLKQPSLA